MNSYPSLVLTCSQAQEGAWNSFLNEVWEFFVDFNYPSYCWTSLADVIENWLCIIRTTGISSSEAVTLGLLIPHSLRTYQQPSLKHTTLETGEKQLKFFHCPGSCDFSLGRRFCFIPYFCNMWISSGNKKGLSGAHGWLSWLRVWLLISAQVTISVLWDGAPCWALSTNPLKKKKKPLEKSSTLASLLRTCILFFFFFIRTCILNGGCYRYNGLCHFTVHT